ncbi:hypothetical protein [Pontibacter sp. G13]|uniref:hypothetical protein n=1 Tax=Pontibacter sp. G13 TaxID=3074898 RepID=UPI00288BD1A5|nr:hypothetical protein [Pontibacter sp. G13]WNJ19368.1 hypothetical protein RJD25_02650 [Pontibacter sp. G13]
MNLTSSPKRLFLIDGLGASLTTFCVGVLMVIWQAYIGLPTHLLQILGGIALIFAIYSLACYRWLTRGWGPFLRIIALANVSYLLLTWSLVFIHRTTLQPFAWVYFTGETLIVLGLIWMEWKVSHSSDAQKAG